MERERQPDHVKRNKESTEVYDLIRVFATIMVVIGHSGYTKWTGDGGFIELDLTNAASIWDAGVFHLFNYLRDWIYGFHMALFFFLSGAVYLYSKKTSSFDLLIKSKIHRLIVPYLGAGLFWMLPVKFMAGFYNKENMISAMNNFMMGGWSGHLWFLLSLFWCFVLFYGFEKYICQKSIALAGIIVIFIYYLNMQEIFSSIGIIMAVPGLFQAIGFFPWFFLGSLFERFRIKNGNSRGNRTSVYLTILLFVLNIFEIKYGLFHTDCLKIAAGILFTYMVSYCLIVFTDILHTKLYRLLLKYSFYIYLFHDPFNFIVLRCAQNWNLPSKSWGGASILTARTIGAVVFSVMLGYVVEKMKHKKWECRLY